MSDFTCAFLRLHGSPFLPLPKRMGHGIMHGENVAILQIPPGKQIPSPFILCVVTGIARIESALFFYYCARSDK